MAESDFSYDCPVSFDDARGSAEYDYGSLTELRRWGKVQPAATDMPGISIFFRDGEDLFRTYSSYRRGVDILLATYNLLDLTPLGRNEARPMEWVRHRDRNAT